MLHHTVLESSQIFALKARRLVSRKHEGRKSTIPIRQLLEVVHRQLDQPGRRRWDDSSRLLFRLPADQFQLRHLFYRIAWPFTT